MQVLHGRIPERHPYSDAPVAVYQSLNDFVGSFRHALFDFIIPVFNLLQLFRMYTPDFLLIEATHQVLLPLLAHTTSLHAHCICLSPRAVASFGWQADLLVTISCLAPAKLL